MAASISPPPPRNMGDVPAPFSPRLKTGGGGTKPPRLYRGGNPALNAYMYRYRRDTESDTKPQFQPPVSVSIPYLIHESIPLNCNPKPLFHCNLGRLRL